MGSLNIFTSNLFEYTYGHGAPECVRVLWRSSSEWLAIPEASPIGPEKKRNDIRSRTARAMNASRTNLYWFTRYPDYRNWTRPDGIDVPSVPAGNYSIHSANYKKKTKQPEI